MSKKETFNGSDSFFGGSVLSLQRRLGVVHGLITLLFEVIAFAIILLIVGLFLVVLLFATQVIMASITLMAAVISLSVAIASVASMVVAILAMMLLVAQIMATSNRKMSHLLFFGCFFSLSLSRMPATLLVV